MLDLYIGSHFYVIFLCKVQSYMPIVRSDLNLTSDEWKESIAQKQLNIHNLKYLRSNVVLISNSLLDFM